MRRVIVGTAGHIDHGKTALVLALTGTDTDRLPEEKRRGITIDLGFAHTHIGEVDFSFVDVPGHEAFVKNMLAGASGIDVALIVIAADEGVMPQTREHVHILQFLGIRDVVVALTKTDLVDDDWLSLVRDVVDEFMADSDFVTAEVVPVSSRTGLGLDELRSAFVRMADRKVDPSGEDMFRLPVDRVFTVRGTGTVVTGTVWSGSLTAADAVTIQPAGKAARVRALQEHGITSDLVTAGQRAAIALARLDRDEIQRGDVIVSNGAWQASTILTVQYQLISEVKPLRQRQRVRFHLGSAELLGRVSLIEGEWAQIRLEQPAVARAGDRFVIRAYSPVTTIGGGVVVEPFAPRRRRRPADVPLLRELLNTDHASDALLKLYGWSGVSAAQIALLLPPNARPPAGPPIEGTYYERELLEQARARIMEAVTTFHAADSLAAAVPLEIVRRAVPENPAIADWASDALISGGELVRSAGGVRLPGFERSWPKELNDLRERLLKTLRSAGLEPPDGPELARERGNDQAVRRVLNALAADGQLVEVASGWFFDRTAIQAAIGRVRARGLPSGILTLADAKEALGVSRKYLIPILEYFDTIGVTARAGDQRSVIQAHPADEANAPISV